MRLLPSVIALAGMSVLALAAEPRGPGGAANSIAPFIDDQTFAVGRVDPSLLDLDAIESLVLDIVKVVDKDPPTDPGPAEIAATKAEAKAWLDNFKKAGGTDLYVVASLADLPESDKPFVVAPLGPGADAKTIAALLFSGRPDGPTTRPADDRGAAYPGMTVERIGSRVVLGSRRTVERLRTLKPAARPEIAKAFEAAGNVPIQIAFVPTADSRRVIEDTLPTLPPELGGGPVTTLTRGVMWAAMGVQTRGVVSIELVIQSQDATSAQTLADAFDKLVKAVAADKQAQADIPGLEQMLLLLKPDVHGDRLVLGLRAETTRQVVTRLVAPPIAQARGQAKRAVSQNNLKHIMLAMFRYGADHKDQWPEDLGTLVKGDYATAEMLVNPSAASGKPGYKYVRPNLPQDKVPARLIAYEAYDVWGEGINVGFGDGHVEFVADKHRFEQMLAEAVANGTPTDSPATQPAATPK